MVVKPTPSAMITELIRLIGLWLMETEAVAIGTECPDHGGVDRLNQRDQNLLNKDWPGQHDDDEQWMLGLVRYRNNAMLHNTLLFK